MVKEQHSAYADREGLKAKDLCGFDARLSWSPEAFQRWREGPAGELAFERGALALPVEPLSAAAVVAPVVVNGDTAMVDGDAAAAAAAAPGAETDGDVEMPDAVAEAPLPEESMLCTKKRCERHKQWARLMLEDVRYEEASLADQMREAERVERQVRETVLLRWREEQANQYGMAAVNGVEVKVGS
jgi:COMPASS component SPP1